ncbi:MAG: hypothetical protein Kow0083_08030 [Methylophaga sp.]
MLLKSLHIASRQLFYLLVVICILGLLGLMSAVWLSDEVAKRKDEIADWASQKIGYPVSIEAAGLYWFDLIPKLEVSQVTVKQKTGETPIITVGQVYLSLDIMKTLSSGEPVVADASIRQARLAVERTLDGQTRLMGLASGSQLESGTSLTDAIRWFSWLKQLELSAISLDYQDHLQPTLSGVYQLQQLALKFAGRQWQTEARILLPQSVGTEILLNAQAEIDEQYGLTAWQATLSTHDLALAPVMANVPLNGLKVDVGLFSGEIHASQNSRGDIQADVDTTLNNTLLVSDQADDAQEQVKLNQLQGRFRFAKQADSWALTADELQIEMAGEAWPVTRWYVQRHEGGEIEATADYVRLSDLSAVAMLMKDMPSWLMETKPAGDVHALSARYQPQTGLQSLQMRADGVALLPWGAYPGANELSFELDWQQNRGSLKLDSHQATIYADKWLDDALYLDSLAGQIRWQRQQDNWSVSVEQLELWNEDLNLSLNGRITQQNAVMDTDLRLELQEVQNSRWHRYVPKAVLPEEFEEWARDAFLNGVIRSGYIEMQGDPAAFPFDEAPERGRFEMQLQVENTQLHYAEGWPDLKGVTGTVSGRGNDLLIESQTGEIAGFAFREVTTTISNLVRHNPVLQVDGSLTGTTANALRFLQNSPLKTRFGLLADWMQMTGNSDIELKLMVPLVDPDKTEAAGYVSFADSELRSKAVPDLKISRINGQLSFNNQGVNAKAIKGIMLDEPVQIDVVPDTGKTRVELKGHTAVAALRRTWPDYVPDFVSGDSDYRAEVWVEELQEGNFDVAFNIHSDLQGVTIDVPPPLGKTASQRKPVELYIDNKKQTVYRLNWGNWLQAALSEKNGASYGQIVLGGDKAVLTGSGVQLVGRLEQLDLDAWLDWQTLRADTQGGKMPIDNIDLHFDELLLAKQSLNDLQLSARYTEGQWQIGLDSPQAKGRLTLPSEISNSRPLTVALEYLKLQLPETDKAASASSDTSALWPAVRLDIQDFELNGIRLGQINLHANRVADSWEVSAGSLHSPVLEATLTGRWTKTATENRSQFAIKASSDDLKALLAYYNYQDVIEARQVELNSQLGWQGDPTAFSLASMQGELDLKTGRGSMIEVEPGTAGRIFGLLRITAIPRRLSLDFSDLFGKGFDFSAITGQFQFSEGIARTDSLTMQGDSAVIEVSGLTNLVDKTYDQIVKITPKVSSTLPLAGAVAGGPVGLGVGTAILLFDKIAGRVFDREIVNLISYRYQLTGPWTDPKLSIVGPASEEGNQSP